MPVLECSPRAALRNGDRELLATLRHVIDEGFPSTRAAGRRGSIPPNIAVSTTIRRDIDEGFVWVGCNNGLPDLPPCGINDAPRRDASPEPSARPRRPRSELIDDDFTADRRRPLSDQGSLWIAHPGHAATGSSCSSAAGRSAIRLPSRSGNRNGMETTATACRHGLPGTACGLCPGLITGPRRLGWQCRAGRRLQGDLGIPCGLRPAAAQICTAGRRCDGVVRQTAMCRRVRCREGPAAAVPAGGSSARRGMTACIRLGRTAPECRVRRRPQVRTERELRRPVQGDLPVGTDLHERPVPRLLQQPLARVRHG